MYLFISFADNLKEGSTKKNDFFTESLEDQYVSLSLRVDPSHRQKTFQDFIRYICPSIEMAFFFSCPNFERKEDVSSSGKTKFLNNVAIRPDVLSSKRDALPPNQEFVFIGDLVETSRFTSLQVKGIEFIDSAVFNVSEIKCSGIPNFAWRKEESQNGNLFPKYDIDTLDSKQQSVITPNFLGKLIKECYTVKDVPSVISYLERWRDYVQFREYYLKKQSQKYLEINGASVMKLYSISKREHFSNREKYNQFIFDGIDPNCLHDLVLLKEKVANSDAIALIYVYADRNILDFNSNLIQQGNRQINADVAKMRSLSRGNAFISTINPKSTENDGHDRNDAYRLSKGSGYSLGDRFYMPDPIKIKPYKILDELKSNLEAEKRRAENEITDRYKAQIDSQIAVFKSNKEAELRRKLEESISRFSDNQKASLASRVSENKNASAFEAYKKARKQAGKAVTRAGGEQEKDYLSRVKEAEDSVSLEKFYIQWDKEQLIAERARLEKTLQSNLNDFAKQKRHELEDDYFPRRDKEINDSESALEAKYEIDVKKVLETETTIRISAFFHINDGTSQDELSNDFSKRIAECIYLAYDDTAERSQLNRKSLALDRFYSGFVKNPYLSKYLFEPQSLNPLPPCSGQDWVWYLDNLNDKQKEAVQKAVQSNGLFLLQGPPGTGKTQVIAETVAHLVKLGKKVLISSETHKAIDNVFDRLPKVPDIIPLRLIPSSGKKTSNYDPEFLVPNFYGNIVSSMVKSVNLFDDFKQSKERFAESLDELRSIQARIDSKSADYDKAKAELQALDNQGRIISDHISERSESADRLRSEIDVLKRTRHHMELLNFALEDGIDEVRIQRFKDSCLAAIDPDVFAFNKNNGNIGEFISLAFSLSKKDLADEINQWKLNASGVGFKIEKERIKQKLDFLRDEAGFPLPGKEEEVADLRNQYLEIVRKEKESGGKAPDLDIIKIFSGSYLATNIDNLGSELNHLRSSITVLRNSEIKLIELAMEERQSDLRTEESAIDGLMNEKRNISEQISEISNQPYIHDINSDRAKLSAKIETMFNEFSIAGSYSNTAEAIDILTARMREYESDGKRLAQENKKRIPAYKKIISYLQDSEVIDEDKAKFTRDLFERANVFGVTSSSRDYFTKKSNSNFMEFGIDNISLRNVGIDVVIIDEVSKSSFIDLLVPILYGKTVILCGDHRQLPPSYDLGKLRKDDFDDLDPNIITYEKNLRFKELFENCFFKTLFENAPDDYRTTLNKQYRCHSQIMDVFNVFYSGILKLGSSNQDMRKEHGVSIYKNARGIITPDKHIYFVNCNRKEERDNYSTSIKNPGERDVAVELIRELNDFCLRNPSDHPLSVGIICTYGDQARSIKEKLRQEKLVTPKGFSKMPEERFLVSTVDDFQGDERDVIIMSLVRNPANPARSDPGFVLAYQRINVALSRARKMLIILGNRDYLVSKGVIDLPDIGGHAERTEKNFHVYEKILSIIDSEGRILNDYDILGGERDKK